MRATLSFGVVGTGGIASDFTQALRASSRCRVVNVVGSSPTKARAFAERFGLSSWSSSLDELLADPNVEAVYVASPHPLHAEHALACIEAGKPVLCEKPLTVDAESAERLIARARSRGVFLMEAFMYRCHPLLSAALARLRAGEIGEVYHVRADFGFRAPRDPSHRLFAPELGGGSILDVGGYPVSFARLIAGLVAGQPFAEPCQLSATGVIGPTGVDELASALLRFESGLTAEVTSAISHDVGTTTVVFGDRGKLVFPDPWIPGGDRHGLTTSFTVFRDGHAPELVRIDTALSTYAIEAEFVADTLPALEARFPAMTHEDSLGNLRTLDAWQRALRSP